MIWKIIGASVIGTSHEKTNTLCQDFFATERIIRDSSEILLCFVSDGAGSASEGGTGAKLVCESAIEFCKQRLKANDLDESFAYELCENLHDLLGFQSESVGLTARDFACTFLGVIIDKEKTLYIQIGDGAIVTRHNFDSPIYSTVFWPSNGEYANTTYFLSDTDYYKHLKACVKEQIPDSLAIFSDGLQHLCLENESKSVHAPFFNAMLLALRRALNQPDIKILDTRLRDYLQSSAINQRTDDDKTLVLLSREYDSK